MAATPASVSLHCPMCTGDTRIIYLQCGHVICRHCLLKSLVRPPTGDNSFACFVCPQIASPDAPMDKGDSEDETGMVGRNEGAKGCDTSINEGETTHDRSADCEEAFCESCLPLQRGQDKRDPKKNDDNVQDILLPKSLSFNKCDIHDELIKVFCHDCKMAACHVCCSINHRSCEKVTSIQDVLVDLIADIAKRKRERVDSVAITKVSIERRKAFIQQISENANKVRGGVKKAIEEAVELLRTKERTLLKELDDFERLKTRELADDNFVDDVIIKGAEADIDAIGMAVKSNDASRIYLMHEKMATRHETDASSDVQRPLRIGFKWNRAFAEASVAGSAFGATYTVEAGDVGRETIPVLQTEIKVSSQQDEADPDVADVVVKETGGRKVILVTDVRNKCIKSFNTDGTLKCISEQKMDEGPFGITSVGSNEILVCFLQNDVVAKFSLDPINLLKPVTKGRNYQGLARYKDGKTIACRFSFIGKSSIDVIDSEGMILRKMNIGFNRSPIFACTTQNGGVLTACNKTKSLLHISPGGKVSQLYRPKGEHSLVSPRAIAVTKTGDILLADFGAHKVIHLTGNGEFIRDLLTQENGINRPHSIVLDGDGLLFVTCGSCVKVFRFE